jgi:hypothetical protein
MAVNFALRFRGDSMILRAIAEKLKRRRNSALKSAPALGVISVE